MKKLLQIMATDMGIPKYASESEVSFDYRIIYSALGLWCLKSALGSSGEKEGVSKHSQSVLLHKLSEQYIKLCNPVKDMLWTSKIDVAVFIRNIYEQTGYFSESDKNYNILNRGEETIRVGERDYLYFGIPCDKYSMDGLGIHTGRPGNEVSIRDFLIRDELTPEKYIEVNYNECDFAKLDVNLSELEFFDARSSKAVYKSWSKKITSDFTMARKDLMGPYYRVMRDKNGELIYAENHSSFGGYDIMTGEEFRRIYIGLRHYYKNPMQVLVCPIDSEYTHISILGQLPNREYYYLLLNSWPKRDVADRNNFIIRNKIVPQCVGIMEKLGFEIRKGVFYG